MNGKHAKAEVPIKDKLLLTLVEAAALSNIAKEVIRDAYCRGYITGTKTKRNEKVFVSRKSLEAWVEYLCNGNIPIDVAMARKSIKERLEAREAVAG